MNKFPIDEQGVQNITASLVKNHKAQQQIIGKLTNFLYQAMAEIDLEDAHDRDDFEWYKDAVKLLDSLKKREIEFANLRFDQGNGHKAEMLSPYSKETNFEDKEETFSEGEMTESELAKHFGELAQKSVKKPKLSKMTLEEIQSWEKAQDNSNDIYKVSARVKNMARTNGNLTSQGEMLCNTFTHVLMSFYDFASNLEDKDVKIKLSELARSKETMPADFIAASQANVREGKTK